ncbi:MAG: hypothetical protein ACRDPK_11900 [Carbonactinosporaceae bacterium]
MSRSGRGRTETFNRAQGRQRLDYARKCHEAAELVGSDHDDTYAGKVAVSLYVLAGISAADAIGAGSVGERWRGEDHAGAIGFLRTAVPDVRPSTQLSTLLDLKDTAHYSTALINTDAQKKAERASAALIEKARSLLA